MTRSYKILVLAALTLSTTVHARQESAAFDVPEGLTSTGTVDGRPASFAVLPDAPSVPVLGPDLVRRAGFSGGILGARGRIGPEQVSGSTGVRTFSLAGLGFKRRAVWFGRRFGPDAASGADVVLGPGSFPADPIRWRLSAAPNPRARRFELPLVSLNGDGFATVLQVGEERLTIQFSLTRDETLATAQAGAALASAFQGRFSGEAVPVPVRLGVARPGRRLLLERSFGVGPIDVRDLLVRTTDYGSTASIPGDEDPSEIVVVGSRKSGVRPISRVVLGRKALARCSELTMDGRRHLILLTCGA